MFEDKKNEQLGQTLLEALIALGAAVVIISVMSILVLSSLNNAQFSKKQNQATQYAQQGIEILKNLSQSNWATFASYSSGSYCLSQNSTTLTPIGTGCGQNVGIFSREIDIAKNSTSCNPSTNNALITVIVSWSDNKCTSATDPFCHKVKLISCIYNSTTVTSP